MASVDHITDAQDPRPPKSKPVPHPTQGGRQVGGPASFDAHCAANARSSSPTLGTHTWPPQHGQVISTAPWPRCGRARGSRDCDPHASAVGLADVAEQHVGALRDRNRVGAPNARQPRLAFDAGSWHPLGSIVATW
jgi:hypothetical protein